MLSTPNDNNTVITRLLTLSGSTVRMGQKLRPKPAKAELISGHLSAYKSPSGILIHTMKAYETIDYDHTLRLSPCLNFCVLLEGSVDFQLSDTAYKFASDTQTTSAFAMNLRAPSDWTRVLKKHRYVSKVVVSLPYEWISRRRQLGSRFNNQITALTQKHNMVLNWQANEALSSAAKKLHVLSTAEVDDLEIESLALAFLSHCFKQTENTTTQLQPSPGKNARAEQIQEHLESRIIVDSSMLKPNLDELSIELGMSKSSLQRSFKSHFGQTIFDYVRTRKLENARDYLQQENANLGEAAYRAGYKHGPNFSKAFKQAFGVAPGQYFKKEV